jgi:transcription termination factor NusB
MDLVSMKKDAIDMELHMAVKTLAILQGELVCNLKELIKKAKLLLEKEEEGEEANSLLEMISDNVNELDELLERKKDLRKKIENLERTQKELMRK